MKILLIFFACASLATCDKTKKKIHDRSVIDGYELEYTSNDTPTLGLIESSTHYIKSAPIEHVIAATDPHASQLVQPGYSVGGPLASIAKGAADQAHTQLKQQPSAAGQAAYVAKNTLAQAAAQSAATAAAALAGKQIIVMGLEQQARDAYIAVNSEKQQLQQAQRAASAAKNAAQQAQHQVQVITTALNAAQTTSEHAAQAAAEAAAELAAQTTMVGQAKARAEAIAEQLAAAHLDFETTQEAARKAANAAQAAQNNAAAAAAHAADTAAMTANHHPTVSLHAFTDNELLSLVNPLTIGAYEYKDYH